MKNNNFDSISNNLRSSAIKFPQHRAFVGRDEINYEDYYYRVKKWAGNFSKYGLRKGDRVAIWLPKCIEYTISIYAALDIGGIYVPMDGMQPVERAKKILISAEPSILITDSYRFSQLSNFDFSMYKLVVLIDGDPEIINKLNFQNIKLETLSGMMKQTNEASVFIATQDDIAAILFTSGSTGVPKGVQISHGNLQFFINWAISEFSFNETDVFSNHAGFHFDLSTFDLFTASAVGAAVWIIREDEQRDVVALLKGIKNHKISVWYSVPSVLTLLVSSNGLDISVTEKIRYILFAGEVFPIRKLQALMSLLPGDCQLYNLYGPTETNVSIFYKVSQDDLLRDKPVYIGKPLPGLSFEIVTTDGKQTKSDCGIGELVITGKCVTPGYWNLNDKNNYENHLHSRHATGDIVGYENGYLFYHGRKDRMLKINGNRVELGEIESVLVSIPNVKEVAVIVQTSESVQNIVIFYSLNDTTKKLTMLMIKSFCREHLPRYMIPRYGTILNELPKNRNGKIDYIQIKVIADSINRRRVLNKPNTEETEKLTVTNE